MEMSRPRSAYNFPTVRNKAAAHGATRHSAVPVGPDAETRQAYTATAADGLREVKTGALRTESPVIEMSLAEVFGDEN